MNLVYNFFNTLKQKLRRSNKLGIKFQLLIYFSIFIVIILVVIWFFQIVFLNDFYKMIKKNEIKSVAEYLSNNLDDESAILSNLAEISYKYNICAMVLDMDNKFIYSNDDKPLCILHSFTPAMFELLISETLANNGKHFIILDKQVIQDLTKGERYQIFTKDPNYLEDQNIIYSVVQNPPGSKILMLNTSIKPVDATVRTLKTQLIYLTIIAAVVAIIIAIIMSKKFSRPIVNLNRSSKQLATGDYNVIFDENGYREVAELGKTLNYATEELSKVERLRKELIANISHDLRTPLTMITGYAELMIDIPGENTPKNIQVIIDESKRLSTLVNDVLDISKLESGNIPLNITRYNITDSIRTILTRYQQLIESQSYIIDFEYESEEVIYADELKISQVVYNLVNNAITYVGNDKYVKIKQISYSDRIVIAVSDNGKGISNQDIPNIWDRYYRVQDEHKRYKVGTGLGLSIVKHIINIHNGNYGVNSKIGEGSTFWISLNRKI